MELALILAFVILILDFIGLICIAYSGLLFKSKNKKKREGLIELGKKAISISIILLIILIIPILLYSEAVRTHLNTKVGNMGDWISFWGSYLGSLIGVAGAVGVSYWTTKKQLVESKKNDFENQIKLADLSRLSEALIILKKCDNRLNQLEKKVKKHDFNFSQETLDNDYDDETSNNYFEWIVKDGEELGILVDDFLMEFTSVIGGLDRSKFVVLENKIDTFKSKYSKVQVNWNQKVSILNYRRVIKVYENFVNLKKAFDSINEETLNFYMDIRQK